RPREGVQLRGKRLGLIGFGGVGAETARIASGIGMEVVAWNRTPKSMACAAPASLHDLLKSADVVSLHLPLTPAANGFLPRSRRGLMKRGSILISAARGALVEAAALIDALNSGAIRRAGLDVFALEPLKAEHPLAKHDSVTLSAHAGFRTYEASETLLTRAL